MPLPAQTGSTLTRSERARMALALVVWAWMAALARGSWDKASQILTVYQQLFNQERQAVLDGFPAAQRSALASRLPVLVVDGRFGQHTRMSMVAVLGAGWAPNTTARDRVADMPASASAIGPWWQANLKPLAVNQRIYDIDVMVRETQLPVIAALIMQGVASTIEGVPASPPPSPSPAAPPPTTAPAVFDPASFVPDFSASSTAVVTGPTVSVTGQHGGMPAWIIGAIGLGVLAAVGVLGYTLYKRKPS